MALRCLLRTLTKFPFTHTHKHIYIRSYSPSSLSLHLLATSRLVCMSLRGFNVPPLGALHPLGVRPVVLALNNLHNIPGARKKKRRTGRGRGSTKGKTSGFGHKGQKARGRPGLLGFEGGQSPLQKRVPKFHFIRRGLKKPLNPLNLDKLHMFLNQEKIDPRKTITLKTLWDSGIVGKFKYGIKLLGTGKENWSLPIHIQVTHASESAKEAIERAGGKCEFVYFNRVGLRAYLRPERFDILPRSPGLPPPKYKIQTLEPTAYWYGPEQLLRGKVVPPLRPRLTEHQKVISRIMRKKCRKQHR